jgi:hypothetical protein
VVTPVVTLWQRLDCDEMIFKDYHCQLSVTVTVTRKKVEKNMSPRRLRDKSIVLGVCIVCVCVGGCLGCQIEFSMIRF